MKKYFLLLVALLFALPVQAAEVHQVWGTNANNPVYFETYDTGLTYYRELMTWNVGDPATLNIDGDHTYVMPSNQLLSAAFNLVTTTDNGLMSATDKVKLNGIATGATANATDATLLNRANHTGTQTADTITDGTANKVFTTSMSTKLAGIATGATANSTDATLLNRANHTGTQLSSTISDFQTNARAAFSAGSGISISSGVISATPSASSGTTANNNRAIGTCFRASTTNDVDFHYSIDANAALVLGGGTATITSYTDSGCTTGAVVLRDGTVSGIVAGGTTSINLDGTLLKNLYAKITTTPVGIGATMSIRAAQQEFTRP